MSKYLVVYRLYFFFFTQKTAYEMRISDWSSDVCSSDLRADCLRINGTPAGRIGPTRRRALGLGVVPEERNGHGAVAELSLAENVLLTGRARLGLVALGFLRRRGARAYADRKSTRLNSSH